MNPKIAKLVPFLCVLLLFVLLGGPQLVQAQQSAQTQPATTDRTGTTEPPQPLPDAPSTAQQPVGTPALPQGSETPQQQDQNKQDQNKKKDQTPLGAAAAQTGPTAGGAASKPAGTAIAPAKQKQMRSFLIKLGAIAAGGAALGAVVALSRGTPSVPPGAAR
ncbi:MAG: hypothetical protein ACR2IF_02515 [Terriglobales bacterium]